MSGYDYRNKWVFCFWSCACVCLYPDKNPHADELKQWPTEVLCAYEEHVTDTTTDKWHRRVYTGWLRAEGGHFEHCYNNKQLPVTILYFFKRYQLTCVVLNKRPLNGLFLYATNENCLTSLFLDIIRGAVVQGVRHFGLRSVGRRFKSCSRQCCVTTFRQVVYTYVPLSPSSITW